MAIVTQEKTELTGMNIAGVQYALTVSNIDATQVVTVVYEDGETEASPDVLKEFTLETHDGSTNGDLYHGVIVKNGGKVYLKTTNLGASSLVYYVNQLR